MRCAPRAGHAGTAAALRGAGSVGKPGESERFDLIGLDSERGRRNQACAAQLAVGKRSHQRRIASPAAAYDDVACCGTPARNGIADRSARELGQRCAARLAVPASAPAVTFDSHCARKQLAPGALRRRHVAGTAPRAGAPSKSWSMRARRGELAVAIERFARCRAAHGSSSRLPGPQSKPSTGLRRRQQTGDVADAADVDDSARRRPREYSGVERRVREGRPDRRPRDRGCESPRPHRSASARPVEPGAFSWIE